MLEDGFENIGSRIGYLRENVLKLTQEEIACYFDMTQSNFSAIEKGRVKPSLYMVIVFSISCKISPSWILFGKMVSWDSFPSESDNPSPIKENDMQLAKNVLEVLPARIKVTRKYCKSSQLQLAIAAGLTQGNVSDIERGNTIPTCENLIALSAAFGNKIEVWLSYDNSIVNNMELGPEGYEIFSQLKKIESLRKERNSEVNQSVSTDCLNEMALNAELERRNLSKEDLIKMGEFILFVADRL